MGLVGGSILGGGVRSTAGGGLQGVIRDTAPDNLKWYFPCADESGGMVETIVGGGGCTLEEATGHLYGRDGASAGAGPAILVPEIASISRQSGDPEFANIFDSSGGFTFGVLINPQVVGDTDGVFRAASTGATTRFILRMEALGKVFVGLLIGGENDNILNAGPDDHFAVGAYKWTFIRVSAAGSIDLFTNATKTTIGSNNSGTGEDGTLTAFEIGESDTARSAITFQHVCGWDAPLTDQQIADIVTATNL